MRMEISNRTPEQIPSEVKFIKEQSSKMLLGNAVGIVRRLTETKALVPHGEWLKWLTKSVSYSPRRGREAKWCTGATFDFNSMYTVFDAKGCFFMHIFIKKLPVNPCKVLTLR